MLSQEALPRLCVNGRELVPTAAFRSYWHVAAERQAIFFRRLEGQAPPWTTDAVLATNRFTNAYCASDRVSQYLINEVIYDAKRDELDVALRTLLFKIFNKIDTWNFLEEQVGEVTVDTFDPRELAALLDERMGAGERLYSAAYIMPSPNLGEQRKHANHLLLLGQMILDGALDRIVGAASLADLYQRLLEVRSFGPFLAFQFAIDLNYSGLFHFSEMDFVVAGPGARDGIAKCFENASDIAAEDVIRSVAESADVYLEATEVDFRTLWGRPLQLIDCQNLFCEVGKYARVAHPELAGPSGRTQIKQRYASTSQEPLAVGYPPKWGLPVMRPSVGERVDHEGSPVQVANNSTSVAIANLPPRSEASKDCLFDLP